MKNTATAAPCNDRRDHQRAKIGIGVELRAHEQHQREDQRTKPVAKSRGSTLCDVLADQRRQQNREQRRPAPAPCPPSSRCSPCTAAATTAVGRDCRKTFRKRATSRACWSRNFGARTVADRRPDARSVSSQMRNNTKPTTATIARIAICGESNQSRSLPLSSMICSAPTHITSRPRPTPSIGRLRRRRFARPVDHPGHQRRPRGRPEC